MSRFIEKLKRAWQAEPPSMGFGRVPEAMKPKVMLVAEVKADAAEAKRLADKADAILLKDCSKGVAGAAAIPCGILLGKSGGLKTATATGADFIAFSSETPLEMLEDEEIGRVLLIETSLEKELLGAIGDMPLDAVIAVGEEMKRTPYTWQHFMRLKGIAAACGKPLLVSIAADVGEDELQLLWQAGIAGVVVEVLNGEEIKKLRKIIDSLKPPSKKTSKARAIVPSVKQEALLATDEEVEEEED
jgi:hypothetical protein